MPIYYTTQEVKKKFDKLSKDNKIEILNEAIDNMQMYNGRSKFFCIALAMGYKSTDEGENNRFEKLN